MSIDIYSMRISGPCRAVLMTAKYLNIDLNIILTDVTKGDQFKPEYLQMNPAHTIPTIVDNGFVLWESRAIMQYLCNMYAPDSSLYPKDPQNRAIVDRWLNFDMSLLNSQNPVLVMKYLLGMEPPEDKVKAYENNLKLLDQLIGDNRFLMGSELTIADLSVLASICYRQQFDLDLSDYPNAQRWWSSLKEELPFYDEINTFSKQELDVLQDNWKRLIIPNQNK